MKISDLFKSNGLKRNISSVLSAAAAAGLYAAGQTPEVQSILPYIVYGAGFFGFSGVVQAWIQGNLTIKK